MTDSSARGAAQVDNGMSGQVGVWDPLVRVFHLGLVLAFAVAWLIAEELSAVHEIAGYAVACLVPFRLVWGLVCSRYSRFVQFLKGPGETLSYLGDMMRGKELRYLGRNPADGAMILALLATLSGTAFTGWLMPEPGRVAMLPGAAQIVAPAWADDDGDRGEAEGSLKEVHETLANPMLLLRALHVGGVVLASFRHRENLAHAMVTGDKRAPGRGDVA